MAPPEYDARQDEPDDEDFDLDIEGNGWELNAPRLAVFPVVPDTMQGLLSLLQIRSVRRMVIQFFYENGHLSIKYPERGKTLPNQHKACKVCGRLGHNTTTHHKTLGLAAEASRHVLCLMKNGENMQSEEVVKQIELVLGALAGITLVAQDTPTPLVLKTVREIKLLYDNLLVWVTNSENRHSRYVMLSPTFDADTQIIFEAAPESKTQEAKLCYRSTLRAAKLLVDKVVAGPVPPLPDAVFADPRRGDGATTTATRIFLFPECTLASGDLDLDKHHAMLMQTFANIFADPVEAARYAKVVAGHRFHCSVSSASASSSSSASCTGCGADSTSRFGAQYDVNTFAACRRCRFLGHIGNVCDNRTPGTKMLLCLATLLDKRKQHRLDNRAVRKSLVNVQRVIMALGYCYFMSKGVDDVLCRFELTRFRTPLAKPYLLVLMRTFNHAVYEILQHAHLGKHIVLGHDMSVDAGSASDAKLPQYTETLRKTVLTVLSNPELLPPIALSPAAGTGPSPGSPVGSPRCIKPSARILAGLTSTGREDCSGLQELRTQTDRGGLTDEELEEAAGAMLAQWRTPHALAALATTDSVFQSGVSESVFMF